MSVHFSRVRVFDGERFLPEPLDIKVADGVVGEMGAGTLPGDGASIAGGVLFPGFVDAHVHLSFSAPRDVAVGGVTTVLDLGAPMNYALSSHPPLRFHFAGPLLTAPGGYPTRSWGQGGYGLELADPDAGTHAVATLARSGVTLIKLALEPRGGAVLQEDVIAAVVEASHRHELRVAAHALDNASVRMAASHGVDILAHTPTDRLDSDVVDACGAAGMWVISTIACFGRSRRTRKNLTALHEAGCLVAYGTDLGNGSVRPGLDVDELEDLERVLGDTPSALSAACAAAGTLAGGGGWIEPGGPADLVWLPSFDRLADLRGTKLVWIDGERVA